MVRQNDDEPEPEQMQYGMIGENSSSTEEMLQKYTGEVDWECLKPHFESGAIIYVDPCLSLDEVGGALAEDDTAMVQAWLKSGDLVKPSEPHASYWEASMAKFRAAVVSPFVLIQPID